MTLFRFIYNLSGSTFLRVTQNHIRKKIYLQKTKKYSHCLKTIKWVCKTEIRSCSLINNMSMDNEVLLAVLFIFAILICQL